MDSQCPGCLGQAVVTLRLPSASVESPWRHKRVPFVNIASVRSRSIKRRQWKHKMDYYGVVFAHLATGRGINAKDPLGLDSDQWIPHSRCCENPARAKALAGFSRHLSAGFTDLNPAPRGLSLYNWLRDYSCFLCACGTYDTVSLGRHHHQFSTEMLLIRAIKYVSYIFKATVPVICLLSLWVSGSHTTLYHQSWLWLILALTVWGVSLTDFNWD